MQIDEFFTGFELSRTLYDALAEVVSHITPSTIRVTKSQVAFWDGKPFLWVWIPGRYLKNRPTAPLVLTVVYQQKDPSPRWKQVVQNRKGWFTHHLELFCVDKIDEEVIDWVAQSWRENTST